MQLFVDELVQQATDVGMIVNGCKTKELLIGSVVKDPPPLVNLSGTSVERVTTFKLLGVHIASGLKWTQNIDAITSKAASRLHFLKQLKRSGAGRDDLQYVTVIRTVLEYACPVWHSSLTAAQTKALESLQRRAMQVIFQDNDYTMSLIRAGLETLQSRRDRLTERFFQRSVLSEMSCLHYSAPGQARSLAHTQTATSKKL